MSIDGSRVLVTGGTGLVGAHLVESLLSKKCTVISTYRAWNPLSYFSTSNLQKSVSLVQGDIANKDFLLDIVGRFEIDYIFHLAAQPLVEVAAQNPWQTYHSNVMGTVSVLEAARQLQSVQGVVVASSDKAYGKQGEAKYVEAQPVQGDHPYEVSKSCTDLIAQSYFYTYGLPITVTRFGNIYGEGDLHFSRIIPALLKSVIRNSTLVLRSDGSFVRDYLYVKDVVNGYLKLAENIQEIKGECFNFGSAETLSVVELVRTAEQILQTSIKFTVANDQNNEIPHQSLNYDKVTQAIGWVPEYNLAKTLPQMLQWYKQIM
jgi:CDP-glucose 4,6-dehydratase